MIQKMKKLTFLVTGKEYDKFISDIRSLGVVHVEELQKGATSSELQAALNRSERVKECLKKMDFAIASYAKGQKWDANLTEPAPADAAKGFEAVERVEEFYKEENRIMHAIDEDIEAVKSLRPFGNFSWDNIRTLEAEGWKAYFYAVGLGKIKAEWAEKYYLVPLDDYQKKSYFAIFSNEDSEPDIPAEKLFLPEKTLSEYRESAKANRERLLTLHNELYDYCVTYRPSVEAALAVCNDDIQLSQVHLSHEDIAEGNVKIMVGWTLEEKEDAVVDYLEKANICYELSDPLFDDEVPIKIKNSKFDTLFEPILRMYSLPNYHDIDPLVMFAPFFMLFFGLCMGDMGYGLIIVAASLAIIFCKKDMASYGKLGVCLGGMTVICGFVTGSFFGIDLSTVDWDFIKPIQPYFLNDSKKDSFFGYSPMMVISIIIGLIQVLLGMTMAGVKAVKNYGFIYGVGKFSWVVALLTAVILFGLPFIGVTFSVFVQMVLYAILAISVFGIFFLNNPAAYNKQGALGKAIAVGSNIGGGVWSTYGMSIGLLGDLLSYIRLFALGLTGGVLGGVFNTLAVEMSPNFPVAHELVMGIILLLGHGINFALCMISSFVHPMRLTFVEYFKNADFTGGGREYKPFRVSAEDGSN